MSEFFINSSRRFIDLPPLGAARSVRLRGRMARAPTVLAMIQLRRKLTSKLTGDNVVETIGPDLYNVSLHTTVSDSMRYVLVGPLTTLPETNQ